jgi:hypothetical protein
MFLTHPQTITVQVRMFSGLSGQSLPPHSVLLPKVKALREALQKAHVCKKVRFTSLSQSQLILIDFQTPQSRDLVYYKLVEWMQVRTHSRTRRFVLYDMKFMPLNVGLVLQTQTRWKLSSFSRRRSTPRLGAALAQTLEYMFSF